MTLYTLETPLSLSQELSHADWQWTNDEGEKVVKDLHVILSWIILLGSSLHCGKSTEGDAVEGKSGEQ